MINARGLGKGVDCNEDIFAGAVIHPTTHKLTSAFPGSAYLQGSELNSQAGGDSAGALIATGSFDLTAGKKCT